MDLRETITIKILSRRTGEPIYSADVPADTPSGMRTRVALEKAVSDRADLSGADLRDAELRYVNLSDADLRYADLRYADLGYASLRNADLYRADLRCANLRNVDLYRADLRCADLRCAYLLNTTGDRKYIKSLQIETWGVTYTATHMQIGCQLHPLERWWSFSDAQISKMDVLALEWWGRWKPVLQQIIAMSPAEPTQAARPRET